MVKLIRSFSSSVAKVLAFIGRHPTLILILPSLWFLLRYLPFWKDIDATVQLIAPAYDDNILHFPPVYCFLARVPFLVVDSLLHGHAPGIFERQSPSLVAVYGLIVVQHIGLWLALRYFVFAFPARDLARGFVVILLASIASFYSFAHTGGSEATTPITYFLIFGAGLRVLLIRSTWRTWLIYTAALFLAVGSRHINSILAIWLPGTAILLAFWGSQSYGQIRSWRSRSLPAFTALLCSFVGLGGEKVVSTVLCHQFGIVERSSVGRTMSGRIATWVDRLSSEQKQALLTSVQRLTNDPLVSIAIQYQIDIGSYDKGTGDALASALRERGFQGEKLLAEQDQLILQSSLCFYRTFNTGLIKEMVSDFWHGFFPANDQGIAIAAPKATFFSLERIAQTPSDWLGISELPIFAPDIANATLERATKDNIIRHWRWVPLLVWTLLSIGVGTWRTMRGILPGRYLLIGLSLLGVGVAVYAANCVCIYAMPRYALPLLVAIIAFGSLVSASRTECD